MFRVLPVCFIKLELVNVFLIVHLHIALGLAGVLERYKLFIVT